MSVRESKMRKSKSSVCRKNSSKRCLDESEEGTVEERNVCLHGWYGIAITPYAKQIRLRVAPNLLTRVPLGNNIYVIDNFLLDSECRSWIDYGELNCFEQIMQAEDCEYAHRDNGRLQFRSDSAADCIFKRLAPFLPISVDRLKPHSCSNNIRLYKYAAGQRFGRHVDESCLDDRSGGETKFTVLMYLSGCTPADVELYRCCGCELGEETTLVGGDTVFYDGSGQTICCVAPTPGRLLLHAQGGRCLTHEGAVVQAGIKYVLRTDVVYK